MFIVYVYSGGGELHDVLLLTSREELEDMHMNYPLPPGWCLVAEGARNP